MSVNHRQTTVTLCGAGFLNSLAISVQVSLNFSSPACRMYCLQISVFHKTGVLNVLSMTWYSRTHDFIFLMF